MLDIGNGEYEMSGLLVFIGLLGRIPQYTKQSGSECGELWCLPGGLSLS